MTICISNGTLINPKTNTVLQCDVWAENGITTKIYESNCVYKTNDKNVKVIDATNKWVVPGFIDLHVHFREPGFEHKEDIKSGCLSAAKGGFTTVCCMPNTKPSIDSKEVVDYVNKKTAEANGVEVLAVSAITKSQAGQELADYRSMMELKPPICAISEDGKSVLNAKLMLEAMAEAKSLNLPVFSHAEDESLGTLPISEEVIVARDILLAKETNCNLHLCHISTKGSVDLIRWAKSIGVNVTAETAPHYFALTKLDVNNDTNKKMNPPLRNEEDKQAIIKALQDGTIDAIATDHAPHSKEEKQVEFEKAPFGVIGLETAFAVSYTHLVRTGLLTPLQLIEKMTTAPAKILGLERGSIEVGKSADIAVIDINHFHKIASNEFVSKSSNSAFVEEKVYGKVVCTIAKGKVIYD